MRKLLLSAVFFALAASATTAVASTLPQGWVGRETCATCHDEAAAAFVSGVHGRAIAARGADLLERSCESCHGPGEAHANDPSATNIRTLKGSAHDASFGCVSCHAAEGAGLALRTPAHVRAGIACLDCHVPGHAAAVGEPLLVKPRDQVCAGCHGAQVAQFSLPFAHREGRTPVECMECHSVHGGTTAQGRVAEDARDRCVSCHTELAGPFVYPHPPMEVDGCVTCHRPHGSPYPKLLTRADVSQICLECHADTPSFHDLSQPKYRNCQTCHAAIHGSQRDRALFKE